MQQPKTLLEFAGADIAPAGLDEACLILIDYQNEYLTGPLSLPLAMAAIGRTGILLKAARKAAIPIIHIAHKGRPGGPFDRDSDRGQIVQQLAPLANEPVIEKPLPNAFANTELAGMVENTGRAKLIMCGFMTHMCLSSTARAALDHDLGVTIYADGCATRDLPDGSDGIIRHEQLHMASLAALSDRFAVIARGKFW